MADYVRFKCLMWDRFWLKFINVESESANEWTQSRWWAKWMPWLTEWLWWITWHNEWQADRQKQKQKQKQCWQHFYWWHRAAKLIYGIVLVFCFLSFDFRQNFHSCLTMTMTTTTKTQLKLNNHQSKILMLFSVSANLKLANYVSQLLLQEGGINKRQTGWAAAKNSLIEFGNKIKKKKKKKVY